MDKQLLKALDNLSVALEQIATMMAQKGSSSEKNSDVTKALQSGNFIEEIKEINIGVKSIKKDTQEILNQQKTILEMSKKKESDKKTGDVESDPKKESSLKKGVASILLIAVAVLAIGMAFKLVGDINFISVIGLGIAIVLVAAAFEKVAKMGMTPKEALSASLVMVVLSGGVLVSSILLSKVQALSIKQVISIAAIAVLFHFMAPVIASLIKTMTTKQKVKGADGKVTETEGIEWGTLIKSIIMVPAIMIGMSLGILVSSMILSKVQTITIQQGITAILISGVFALAAGGIVKLLGAFNKEKISLADALKAAIILPFIMVGMSAGIWLSSMILGKVQPIGIPQAISSILIAAIFTVAAYGMAKIIKTIKDLSPAQAAIAAIMLPLLLPAMSAAIWASSYFLSKTVPISFGQFITALGISLLFVVLSFGISKIIKAIGKMKWTDVPKIPVFFTLISLAIAASAFIFSKSKEAFEALNWSLMLKILVFGVIMGIIAIVFSFAVKIMGNIEWSQVIKLPIFFTLLSLSIAASAFIFFKAKEYIDGISFMMMLKLLVFGVVLGIIAIVLAVAIKVINLLGSVSDYVKGGLSVIIIATSIMLSSKILGLGEYRDYSYMFKVLVFGVVLAIASIVMAITIKILKLLGGVSDYAKGGLSIIIIATTIMLSSIILSKGEYKEYSDMLKLLVFGVVLAIVAIVMAIAIKIINILGGVVDYIKGGLCVIIIAATIVLASKILNYGDYKNYPDWRWTLGVGLALLTFGVAMVALGLVALTGIGLVAFLAGAPLVLVVAATIVATAEILSKGKYDNKGMLTWAISTSLLFGTFVPIIIALGALGLAGGVLKFFGADDPFETAKGMLIQIAESIVAVAEILNKGKYTGGPTKEWAEGISIALGAFSPIYTMLMANGVMKLFGGGGVGPDDFAKAILTVSIGIMTAAELFAGPKNKGVWKGGPTKEWAEGVGTAIGAFAPVLKILSDGAIISLFGGKGVDANAMKGAIISISEGIIEAAGFFAKNKAVFTKNYPDKAWGEGVGAALGAFAPVFASLQGKGWFTSGKEVIAEMKLGILQMADAIVMVSQLLNGGILVGNTVRMGKGPKPNFSSYPTKEWADGIGTTVIKFSALFTYLSKQKGGIASFRTQSAMMNAVFISVAGIAAIIKRNEANFKATIPQDWISNLSGTVIGYSLLTKAVEAIFTTKEKWNPSGRKVSTEISYVDTGAMGVMGKLIIGMATTAAILFKNKKYFEYLLSTEWVVKLTASVIRFAILTRELDKLLTTSEKVTKIDRGVLSDKITTSTIKKEKDMSIVARTAANLSLVARILWQNSKFFQFKIDPDFMKNVGSNILAFAILTKKISAMQSSGGLGGMLKKLVGQDPMSQMADGMVKIATAYDILARSLTKFGGALSSIDGEKVSIIKSLTGNIAVLASMDAEMFDRVMSVLESKASVFSKLIEADKKTRPSVGDKKSGKESEGGAAIAGRMVKKTKTEDQLDQIITQLKAINYNTSGIDEWLASQEFGPDLSAKL